MKKKKTDMKKEVIFGKQTKKQIIMTKNFKASYTPIHAQNDMTFYFDSQKTINKTIHFTTELHKIVYIENTKIQGFN